MKKKKKRRKREKRFELKTREADLNQPKKGEKIEKCDWR